MQRLFRGKGWIFGHGLMIKDWPEKLQAFLENRVGYSVFVSEPSQLSGGAIQENWAIDITVAGGEWSGFHQLVLRSDAMSSVKASRSRIEEFALINQANKAGVLVPKPYFLCDDEAILGRPFFLMERLDGMAAGHKLARGEENPELLYQLGKNLALIHSITPPKCELSFLHDVPKDPAKEAIALYREFLDALQEPHPAIEWGLRWLEVNVRPADGVVLCHRDFRTGNLLVKNGVLAGVLDWEFAGWSDPHEDIFWFTAKCWRFGANHRPAGGLGQREDFYRGYEENAGRKINRELQVYWEVMAHVRWATIACQQAERNTLGIENSLELALTGHVVPELELEILSLTKEI